MTEDRCPRTDDLDYFTCPPSSVSGRLRGRQRRGLGLADAATALLAAAAVEIAEVTSEPGIADPDHGSRIADAFGLEGHRSRVVGSKGAHEPRRQHGAGNRFQFAAPHLLFRRYDLER